MLHRWNCGGVALALLGALFAPVSAQAQWVERGSKIAADAASARQGSSVALSADGSTLIEGGPYDGVGCGAAWAFTRSGAGWVQQGPKLTPGDSAGERALFGSSVALSADGNTALIGGQATYVFTRADGAWKQQAALATGSASRAVALSADGNTAILTGVTGDSGAGATWVFTRSGSAWTQQGEKLEAGGRAVALSADGNTALTAGPRDAWIFTRSGDTWTQQARLATGGSAAALSADGNTAVIARSVEDGEAGAAWLFTRSADLWTPRADKLSAPPGSAARAQFGFSVALSGDGNRLLVGAPASDGGAGAAWEFRLADGSWAQVGKLVGSGASGKSQQGYAVSLSADGHTGAVGGVLDRAAGGALWIFADPTLSIAVPAAATAGVPVTVTVTAQDDRGNPVARYPGTLHFASSDTEADLPPDAQLANGAGVFNVTFKTHGRQTITAGDAAVTTITATSDPVSVSAGPAARFLVEVLEPASASQQVPLSVQPVDSLGNPADYDGAVRVTSTDPFALLPAGARLHGGGRVAVTLRTPGDQTVTVTSAVNPRLSGSVLIPHDGGPSPTDYVSVVVATSPIAYFRLEATTDTSKVLSYTSTFTGAGATLTTPGAPICEPNNHSATLDGVTGWVTTTLSGGINGAGSIAAWVNIATLPSIAGHIYYVAGESQNGNDFDLQFTTDNFIRFYVSNNGINVGYQPNAQSLVGAWHMVVATFDSTTNIENLYWDGQLVATANNAAFTNKTAPFTIGESDVFTNRFFGGQIDEVTLWNSALTAAQVQSIYNSATCSPLTVNDPEVIHVTDTVPPPIGSLLLPDTETIHVTDTPTIPGGVLINVNPPGAGTVTGGGIYANGATATLTATANPGYIFADFNGGVPTTSANPLKVTVNGSLIINANFLPANTVTVNINPPGAGTVTGAGQFIAGFTTNIAATANPGYVFANFTYGTTTNPDDPLPLLVTGPITITANFLAVVTVNVNPPVASITATPNPFFSFANFSGSVPTATNNPLMVTVNAPLTIVANFTPLEPSLAVSVTGAPTVNGLAVTVPVTLTNAGKGEALNAYISSVTATALGGAGTLNLVNLQSGVPSQEVGLGLGASYTVPVVFSWLNTATRASFRFGLTYQDSQGTIFQTTQTVTLFR